jgi:flagellar biosynthetic protein FlhB
MSQNRTERATPKRREEARRKGQIARRPEVAAAASFLAAHLMMRATGDDLWQRAAEMFRQSATHLHANDTLDAAAVQTLLTQAGTTLAALSLPVIVAYALTSVGANLLQGGFVFTPSALMPRAEKFNPVANLKRVFGGASFVELVKSVLKLIGIGAVGYGLFKPFLAAAPTLLHQSPPQILATLGAQVYALSLRAGVVLLIIGALDYGYGWYKNEKSLRMTKQEVKDEFRQQEGDPLVKNQRRRMARARVQRRIAVEVPKADVVVTNPTHFAVALRYDRTKDAAPRVVAKGADLLAARIREIARAHDVAIVENPPLARALYKTVDAGRMIPVEMFRAVAELLAYVYQREAKYKTASRLN